MKNINSEKKPKKSIYEKIRELKKLPLTQKIKLKIQKLQQKL